VIIAVPLFYHVDVFRPGWRINFPGAHRPVHIGKRDASLLAERERPLTYDADDPAFNKEPCLKASFGEVWRATGCR